MMEVIVLLTVLPVVVAMGLILLDAVRDHRQDSEAKDEDSESTGLICMFCGATGYETQEELEAHIDSHPYTKRREN